METGKHVYSSYPVQHPQKEFGSLALSGWLLIDVLMGVALSLAASHAYGSVLGDWRGGGFW